LWEAQFFNYRFIKGTFHIKSFIGILLIKLAQHFKIFLLVEIEFWILFGIFQTLFLTKKLWRKVSGMWSCVLFVPHSFIKNNSFVCFAINGERKQIMKSEFEYFWRHFARRNFQEYFQFFFTNYVLACDDVCVFNYVKMSRLWRDNVLCITR